MTQLLDDLERGAIDRAGCYRLASTVYRHLADRAARGGSADVVELHREAR